MNLIAISVGYSFGIVPEDKVSNIDLKSTNQSISMNGETYPLYKASTYEGSRMIDQVLDDSEEFSVSEYLIKN